MKKYRLMLKNNGQFIHSILLQRDSAPCAQEIFDLFKNDEANKTIVFLFGDFKKNMNNFSFEAYELPENFGDID